MWWFSLANLRSGGCFDSKYLMRVSLRNDFSCVWSLKTRKIWPVGAKIAGRRSCYAGGIYEIQYILYGRHSMHEKLGAKSRRSLKPVVA